MKLSGFFRRLLVALGFTALLVVTARAQTSLTTAQVGVAYTFAVTTTPAAPTGTVYGITGLPASSGLSLNATSGVISGTPTTAGSYSGIISITPPGAGTNNLSYSLTVNAALGAAAITSATTASAVVNTAFVYVVTASNSPTSFNVGTLPPGLSFNSGAAQIEGTPTLSGTYTVALSANNGTGAGATTTLTLTVAASGPVPAIDSAATASATAVLPAGTPPAFTVSFQATATNAPLSFSASGLPLGVSIASGTGAISGTTTVQGVYTVVLSATNNNGAGPTSNLTLTVGSLSAITTSGPLSATVGTAIGSTQLAATNSPQSFNVSGLPPGLSVNTSTGVISGTPTTAGSYTLTVSANNAVGVGPTATVVLTVTTPSGGGGGGGSSAPAPSITSPGTALAVLGEPFAFSIVTSPAATEFSASGLPAGVTIDASTGMISGTFSALGQHVVILQAQSSGGVAVQVLTVTVNSRPAFTLSPQSTTSALGAAVVLSAVATGSPAPSLQWRKNGVAIPGANGATLTLRGFQVGDAGSYTLALTNITGTVVSQPAVVGVTSTAKVAGAGGEVGTNIVHPNGNVYDQVLLTGASATITADATQVTRVSFIDLNDDIVQVEFGGRGTLTLALDNATGPAAPVKYNQPGVTYMKGHASLVITGADETTNVSVFSVGTLTAVNQALFKQGEVYDGVADLGLISITSVDGKFAGIRTANAGYFRVSGLTGIHAPGVAVSGPVFVGDINADADATPVLIFGSTTDVRITGGDLLQLNSRALQVDGITQIQFAAGTKSGGALLPAQPNRGRLERNGADVTSQLVR